MLIANTHRLRIVNVGWRNPGIKGRYRIVLASDLHLPCLFFDTATFVDMLNQTNADALILAGDIVDRAGGEHLVSIFKNVELPIKIAVLGNWEYYGNLEIDRLEAAYRAADIQLIVNRTVRIGQLPIIGLDDYLFGRPDYGIVKRSTTDNQVPHLVISHCPGDFKRICSVSRSPLFVVSGHTHGGQIRFFGKAIVLPKGSGPYLYGKYQENGNHLFVTRGVGTSGLPLRIGARPEIVVINIESGAS